MITLDTFGLKVELEVVGYEPNSDGWCGLDFHVRGMGVDLHINRLNGSVKNSEIEDLTRFLGSMLNDKLNKSESIYCSKSDFYFFVLPKTKRLVIKMNILEDGHNTPNYLELNFYEEECNALYEHLTQAVGVLSNSNSAVGGDGKTYRYVKVVYDPESSAEYSYLDEDCIADYDDYVWVPVGKYNEERLAFVVELNDFTVDRLPYPLDKVKKVLRLASEEEVAKIEECW